MNIHRETMKQHRETRMDRGDWPGYAGHRPEYLLLEHGYHIAYPGMVISPKDGGSWYCLEGHVSVLGQTGGAWFAHGESRQTVVNQRGGWWQAFGNSGQVVIGQREGRWSALDTSRQVVIGQCEGGWRAWDTSRQTVINEQGGSYSTYEKARQHQLKPKEEP